MRLPMKLYTRNGWYYIRFSRTKKRALRTKDPRLAQRLFRSVEREILKGRLIQLDEGKKTTLAEFKDIFFKKHTDIADDTHDAYDLAFKLFIDSVSGSTLLYRVNENSIDKKYKLEALYYLAVCYEKSGDLSKAQETYREVSNLRPSYRDIDVRMSLIGDI